MNSLKKASISGIKWNTLSSFLGVALQIVQMSILARLLNPAMFGLMALAMVVMDFSGIFMDMGFSNAIIQKEKISSIQLSSLFWLNLLLGGIIFLLVFLFAPVMASFYHQPELVFLVRLVSFSFLIKPLEIQFQALLRKDLQFKAIARRDILVKLFSAILGISAAFYGLGVYSLVVLYYSNAIISAALIIPYGLKIHKPRFVFSLKEIRPFFSFSFFQTVDSILLYFNRQVDSLLIGKLFPIHILGGYNIAKNLAIRPYMMINPVVTQVSFPVLAKVQNDKEAFGRIFIKTLNYLNSINLVIYIFLAIFARSIIQIIYGENWQFVVPVFQVLCLAYMVRAIISPMGTLVLAKGKPKLSLYWNIGQVLLFPIAVFISVKHGIIAVAFAHLIMMGLSIWPAWKFIINPLSDISKEDFFSAIGRPAMVSLAIGLFLYLSALLKLPAVLQVIVGGIILSVLFLPFSRLFNPVFFNECKIQLAVLKLPQSLKKLFFIN